MAVLMTAVGDILVDRKEPDTLFAHTAKYFRESDIAFGQMETCYSDKGSKGSSGPRGANNKDPHNLPAIPNAGFNVVSVASNHILDWGRDALLDCIERFRKAKVVPFGAGANSAEARTPAIIERGGMKIGFLGYCSVAPKSYYSAAEKCGVAPMQAITHYEPIEDDQPGNPARIMTYPFQPDLDALLEDVKKLRPQVDILIVSIHWGIHHIKGAIADYQPVVAHAAIDAGCDLILGHHPHILHGVEIYKGKVVLYSMGNFAFDLTHVDRGMDAVWNNERKKFLQQYWNVPPHEKGDNKYLFQPDARYSMIVKVTMDEKKIKRVSFVPVVINKNCEPVPYSPSSPEGKEVIDYLTQVTQMPGLNGTFTVEGEEVVILK